MRQLVPEKAAPTARKPPRPLLPAVGPLGRFFSGLVAGLLASLSPRALGIVASAVGRLAWTLRIRRKVALDNLRHAFPEWTLAERRRVALGAYRNMALTALESIGAGSRGAAERDALVELENWELFDQTLAQGKGVLVAAAHFGNWELMGEVMCRRGVPVNAVVRPLSGAINERIVRARLRAGMKLIHPRGAVQGTLQALSRGEAVAMLVDQVISARHGIFVPFFGRQASTNPALSLAAKRSGAPVLLVMAVRQGRGVRLFVEGPFPVPDTGDLEADLRAHTERVTWAIEAWIRRYPEQWLWLHRRWKVQPPA